MKVQRSDGGRRLPAPARPRYGKRGVFWRDSDWVFRDAVGWLSQIIGPDSAYVRLGIVYTIAISLLALATPISVQLLINSVANTAMPAPLWALSGVLLMLLLMVAGLSALRVWIMAAFERRLFSRVVAEVTVRAVHAQDPFFADGNRGDLFNRYFDLVVVQKSVPSLSSAPSPSCFRRRSA